MIRFLSGQPGFRIVVGSRSLPVDWTSQNVLRNYGTAVVAGAARTRTLIP
jgi:hypothetical protein